MTTAGTILLVGDDPSVAAPVRDCLSSSGFAVESVHDQLAALDLAKTRGVDAAIIDVATDDGSGLEVLVSIRQADPSIGVILITDDSTDEKELPEQGHDGYITMPRPVHLQALLNHIRNTISVRLFQKQINSLLAEQGLIDSPLGDRLRLMEQLLRFDHELMTVMDYRRAVDVVLGGLLELTGADAGLMIAVRNQVSMATGSVREGTPSPSKADLHTSLLSNWETWGGPPLNPDDLVWSGLDAENEAPARHISYAPLMAHDQLVGAIAIAWTSENEPLPDAQTLLSFVAVRTETVVENVLMHENTKILATTDALTGLMNRRVFLDGISRYYELSRRLHRSGRHGAELSVIMSDVDHFKNFNDTYGHQLGDKVLKTVARVLMDEVRRASDICARYGGEEFIIVLPDTSLANAKLLAERIRHTLAETDVESSSGPLRVTASFGVSSYPEFEADSVEMLIEQCDEAMYKAKNNGRNRVESAEARIKSDDEIIVMDSRP
jgi:diguanylate cyclase (GGDEF)-like protein